jgi:hypothetical protein
LGPNDPQNSGASRREIAFAYSVAARIILGHSVARACARYDARLRIRKSIAPVLKFGTERCDGEYPGMRAVFLSMRILQRGKET